MNRSKWLTKLGLGNQSRTEATTVEGYTALAQLTHESKKRYEKVTELAVDSDWVRAILVKHANDTTAPNLMTKTYGKRGNVLIYSTLVEEVRRYTVLEVNVVEQTYCLVSEKHAFSSLADARRFAESCEKASVI